METQNVGVYWAVIIATLLIVGTVVVTQPAEVQTLSEGQVQSIVASEIAKISIELPTQVMPTADEIASKVIVDIPKVENADNQLLNEFLENQFSSNYSEIEDAALNFATEDLEKRDYKVIVNYLKNKVEGIDEDSIDVDVKDTEINVLKLGLEKDSDKQAEVIFEVKVYYELLEGVNDEFKEKLYITYEVTFDEGDLNDESVDLISIE